jgi:hypothetical protein
MKPGAAKALWAMVGIFLAGGVVGGLAGNAWARHKAVRISAQEFVDRQLKKRVDQLELTDEQISRIKPIMKDHEESIRASRRRSFQEISHIWRDMNARIEHELAPEQLEKFRLIQKQELERFERQVQSRSRRPDEPAAPAATPPSSNETPPSTPPS